MTNNYDKCMIVYLWWYTTLVTKIGV
jgi:hypothetical protein